MTTCVQDLPERRVNSVRPASLAPAAGAAPAKPPIAAVLGHAARCASGGEMAKHDRRQLARFYLGTFWLYGADQFVLLAARWGMVALARSPIMLALVVILHALPQVAVGVLGPERAGGRRLTSITLQGGAALAVAWLAGLAGGGALMAALLAAALFAGFTSAVAVPLGQASLMQFLPVAERVRGSRGYEVASRIPMLAAWAYRRWPEARTPRAQGLLLRRSLTAVRRDRWLLTALLVRGVQNLFWPAFTLGLPLLVADRLHGGALAYGLLLSSYGVATLLTAGLSGRLQLAHLRWLYYLSWVTTGFGFVLLAMAGTMPLAVLGAALTGIGSPFVHMALDTHIGTNVDAQLQSALFGLQRLVMSVLSLVGAYAVGWWLTRTAPAHALATSGAALAAVGVAGASLALLQGRTLVRDTARRASP